MTTYILMAEENTNLEVQIGRLDERLKSLDAKQDDHHKTVLAELKEIKDNITPRLSILEQTTFTKGDFSVFYNKYTIEQDEQNKDITKIKDKLIKWSAMGVVIIVLMQLFLQLLGPNIVNKLIH